MCENVYRSGRLHGLVLVLPAEVSLKLKLRPLLDVLVRTKMTSRIPFYFENRNLKVDKISHDRAPEHFDDTAEKEDVEEDDEEGGDGEEVDAAAVVHPTVNRIIALPDHNLDRDQIEEVQGTCKQQILILQAMY